MAIGAAAHLAIGLFGFGCALLPLWARVPGPLRVWGLHAVMAAAMGVMAVVGMAGAAGWVLTTVLLAAASWAWYELPRRREGGHVVVDLLAMALLLALAPSPGAAEAGHVHGGLAPDGGWAAPAAVFLFWLATHAACLAQTAGRVSLRDSLSSLGMIASMAVMGLLA